MQISTIVTLAVVLLAVVCYSSANPTPEEELNIIDPATLDGKCTHTLNKRTISV